MYLLLVTVLVLVYLGVVTYLSRRLARHKTNDPNKATVIGFLLAFLPPLALIYLVVLLLKQDVDVV